MVHNRARECKMRLLGLEPRTYGLKVRKNTLNSSGKHGISLGSAAPGAARKTVVGLDLAKIIAAWPVLAEPIKLAMMALLVSGTKR